MRKGIFLSPSAMIIPIALVIPLAACVGGRVIPIGQNNAQLSSVDPTVVTPASGVVPACNAGAAHPNVCCTATENAPAACGTYDGEPFHACGIGAKTYPDPRSCCDLADPTQCADPPPTAVPPPVACAYLCSPGYYLSGDSCCSINSNGTSVCYGVASTGISVVGNGGGGSSSGGSGGIQGAPSDAGVGSPPTSIDAGRAPSYDAGGYDAGGYDAGPYPYDGGQLDDGGFVPPPMCDPVYGCSTPPSCGIYNGPNQPTPVLSDGGPIEIDAGAGAPQGGPTTCPVTPPPAPPCDLSCPTGWQPAQGAPDVCCKDNGDGSFECFSQATGPVGGPGGYGSDDGGVSFPPTEIDGGVNVVDASTPPDDAGVPSARACGGAADGSSCSCSESVGGTTYMLQCSATSCACSSETGSSGTGGANFAWNMPCGNPSTLSTLWTNSCKFPN